MPNKRVYKHREGYDPYARLCSNVLSGAFSDIEKAHRKIETIKNWKETEERNKTISEAKILLENRIKFLLDENNPWVLYLNTLGHVIDEEMIASVIKKIKSGLFVPKVYGSQSLDKLYNSL